MSAALMAIGVLIVGLCLPCTVLAMVYARADAYSLGLGPGSQTEAAVRMALIGALPTLIGVAIFFWGWTLRRRSRRSAGDKLAISSDDER